VTFRGHSVTFLYVGNKAPDLNDFTGEFMSDDEWRLAPAARPRIPVVDVEVGAAHARAHYTIENFFVSDSRLGNVAHGEAGTC
jgi:hypothetical protein